MVTAAQCSALYHLYNHPEEKRKKESELKKIFEDKLGRDLGGYPILIDIPSFSKTLQIDLNVFFGRDLPEGDEDPLHFDHPHVSKLKEYLVDNFEDHAKVFRIFCKPDEELQEAVKKEVKRYLS